MSRYLAAALVPLALFMAAALPLPLPAAELQALIQEYTAQKQKARGGDPGQRREKANRLKPLLLMIARLDTPEALGFLRTEFEKESPEIAANCVEPLLAGSSDKALEALLSGLQKKPRAVREEVLAQLAVTKRDLSSLEPALIGLLQRESELRKDLPPILGRLDSPPAARALVQGLGLRPKTRARGADDGSEFDRRAVAALKAAKSEEVKAWLSGEAFSGAPPARIRALAEISGAMKLEAARPELEKHVDDADESVAVAVLEALLKIGPGPSSARIAESLRRGKRSLAFRIQGLDTLAASGTEENVALVREAAVDPDPDTRAIALGSLARVPGSNQAAYEGIIAGLKDQEATVRAAAIRALKDVRHKAMVPALIDAMASEKEERVKIDVLQLLLALTGKNMGLVAEDWKKWWEVSEPKFEFAKGEVQVTASRSHDLKYFGVEITSKRLAFAVDASGSMLENVDVYLNQNPEKEGQGPGGGTRAVGAGQAGGQAAGDDGAPEKSSEKPPEKPGENPGDKPEVKKSGPKGKARKIDVLKKEMARVVGELPRDTLLNLVTFSGSFKPWQDALQPMAGGGREKALAFVKDIQTSSGTNVFDTLEFVLKDKRVDTVFLLTDGLPTKGKFTDAPSILREVRALNRVRGVTINCIAFGAESPFLKDLAKENGGVYRFVDSY